MTFWVKEIEPRALVARVDFLLIRSRLGGSGWLGYMERSQ